MMLMGRDEYMKLNTDQMCSGQAIQKLSEDEMPSVFSIGEQSMVVRFDPNDAKYQCCCMQCHAKTGVKIIAGLLCMTVALELWHFAVTAVSSGNGAALVASASQLLVGAAIAWTVIYALWTEKAGYLLPYLVLQSIGLAAGTVFLITFFYISLFGNSDTMLNWLETQGHIVEPEARQEFEEQIGYISWLLVLSFVLVVALQVWLISIVVACWRYFREKRAHGYIGSYGAMSYVIFTESDRNPSTATMLAQYRQTQPSLEHYGSGRCCQQLPQLQLPENEVFHSKVDASPSCSLAMSLEELCDRK